MVQSWSEAGERPRNAGRSRREARGSWKKLGKGTARIGRGGAESKRYAGWEFYDIPTWNRTVPNAANATLTSAKLRVSDPVAYCDTPEALLSRRIVALRGMFSKFPRTGMNGRNSDEFVHVLQTAAGGTRRERRIRKVSENLGSQCDEKIGRAENNFSAYCVRKLRTHRL